MLGGLSGVGDERLQLALDMAQGVVCRSGVPETQPEFADLQRVYAAHLLEIGGVSVGAVTSKRIGDVSVQFARGAADQVADYGELYQLLLTQVRGFRGRLV